MFPKKLLCHVPIVAVVNHHCSIIVNHHCSIIVCFVLCKSSLFHDFPKKKPTIAGEIRSGPGHQVHDTHQFQGVELSREQFRNLQVDGLTRCFKRYNVRPPRCDVNVGLDSPQEYYSYLRTINHSYWSYKVTYRNKKHIDAGNSEVVITCLKKNGLDFTYTKNRCWSIFFKGNRHDDIFWGWTLIFLGVAI